MSTLSSTAISFFSLINKNKGLFKSTKQADFLKAKCVFGEYSESVNYHFGEWQGKTNKNTKTLTWVFQIDAEGVVAVYKNSSKGSHLHWCRKDADLHHTKQEEKRAKKTERLAEVEEGHSKIEALNALYRKKAEVALAPYVEELRNNFIQEAVPQEVQNLVLDRYIDPLNKQQIRPIPKEICDNLSSHLHKLIKAVSVRYGL